MKKSVFTVMLTLVLLGAPVFAQDSKSSGNLNEQGWYANTLMGASMNYLGLMAKGDIFYRMPLIDKPGVLWRSTKLDLGIQEYLSPAFSRTSAFVKVEPIAVFDVDASVGYDYMYQFGDSPTLAPGFVKLASENSEYDRDSWKDQKNKDRGGLRVTIIPTLKFAIGPVAALYSFRIIYHDYSYDGYYYDHQTFSIHKGMDTYLEHDAKVLYKLGSFRVGVNFVNYQIASTKADSSRLAAMAIYTPVWKSLDKNTIPTFGVQLGSYIDDRYHEGDVYFAFIVGMSYKL